MPRSGYWLDRRLFLTELGRAAFALTVLGGVAAACSLGEDTPGESPPTASPSGVRFSRVDLGFVSAYIVVRAGEAALVDTGVSRSEPEIRRALEAVGLSWGAVGHVILTHKHPDHVGSLEPVLVEADDATPYAGEGDIPVIASPRPIQPVGDGDAVFGLEVIATPGHTPGHISVLDREAGVLITGDALNGQDGRVAGPNPRFTEDMDEANRSVRKLAALSFDVAYFGHGDPVEGGAGAAVAALARDL